MRLINADKLEAHEQISPLGNGMYESAFVVYKDDIDAQPTVDAIPITFERFRFVCKFFGVGCDEDRQIELTCRRKDMIPEGCSWGICDKEHCPYMKAEEDNG